MSAGGVGIIADGHWFGYVATAVFGLGLVASLIQLLPSSFLELDDSSFVVRNLFRHERFYWATIEMFGVRRVNLRKMVTLKLVPEYTHLSKARAVIQALSGMDGGLPDAYRMSAEDLRANAQ